MRFPHLSEFIFDNLDNQSLANCKIASKTWSIYIGEQKFYGVRILKETVKKFHKLSKPWFEFFKKGTTENIMELKNCFDQFGKQEKKSRTLTINSTKKLLHYMLLHVPVTFCCMSQSINLPKTNNLNARMDSDLLFKPSTMVMSKWPYL